MGDLQQLLFTGGRAPLQRQIITGQVSRVQPLPRSFSDPLYVIVPAWNINNYFTITNWPACHGSTLPTGGAEVTLVRDDGNNLICVWWAGETEFSESSPWLGLNGNHIPGFGALDFWSQLGVVYDRIEIDIGSTTDADGEALLTTVASSVSNGMIPVIVIEPTGYSGAGSMALPTGAGIPTFAAGFVSIALSVMAAYPAVPILFEITNEPWFYTGATGGQYADLVVATLQACQSANITLDRVYTMVNNTTWLTAMYTEQPTLGTMVEGWSMHPYGPPPPGFTGDGEGIAYVGNFRQNLKSGANNILISEVGFWTPDVNGGASGGPGALSSAFNSTQAALWMTELLQTALTYRQAGWLKALLIYHRNDGGWAMQLSDGSLTAQGSVLASFPQPLDPPVPAGQWTPGDDGLVASTFVDPAIATGNADPPGSRICMARVRLDRSSFVSKIRVFLMSGGTGMTTGQNFLALYDADGNRILVTGDQSTAWAGGKGEILATVSGQNLAPGYYWIGILMNNTANDPIFSGIDPAVGAGQPPQISNGGVPRWMFQSTAGATSMPSTLNLTSGWFVWNQPIWAALS
jgi:hypothetical protein